MKKIFTMAVIALFTMSSCSSDDAAPVTNTNNNPEDAVVLVKKTIITFDGEPITTTYNYDGTKITSITGSSGYQVNNTYENDKLVMQQEKDGETIVRTSTFSYQDNKLSECKTIASLANTSTKVVYIYNEDSTITTETYKLSDNGSTETLQSNGLITFTNGNITSYKTTMVGATASRTTTYTYDDKNDPFKNTFTHAVERIANIEGGNNNILTRTIPTGIAGTNFVATYSYTYNSANYPVTETYPINDSETIVTQYFYE